jgi:YfiH family protein
VKLPEPFYAREDHFGVDLDAAQVVFTTRRGGFSTGRYESLNLGRLTDDRAEDVSRNRESLRAQLGVRLAHIRQVHGSEVLRVTEPPEDPGDPGQLPRFDGQATALAGVAPMVLVADCLPVAVAAQGAVAMLHAGWRGLAGGIIEEGLSALRELGATDPFRAAIGPGAGPCCYEVGEEVHAVFAEQGLEARQGSNLDLKAIARTQLHAAGVETVHDLRLCTICSEPSLLFSHRRDGGVTGRQAGIAWLSR